MAKPSEIILGTASAMNDSAQRFYNNANTLPYLNMALDILQEIYELNDIPVTTETSSAPITIKAGVGRLGFDTTPAFPSDLIEIKQLWESTSGLSQWTPMIKKDTIPHYLEDNTTISMFLIWCLEGGRVILIPSNQDNDLKIDYVGKLFNTPIQIKDINVNLPFTNIKTYLEFQTAALCNTFVARNPTQAQILGSLAQDALSRALGIPIKGMQSVVTRRRPFRHSFKHRGVSY